MGKSESNYRLLIFFYMNIFVHRFKCDKGKSKSNTKSFKIKQSAKMSKSIFDHSWSAKNAEFLCVGYFLGLVQCIIELLSKLSPQLLHCIGVNSDSFIPNNFCISLLSSKRELQNISSLSHHLWVSIFVLIIFGYDWGFQN